MAGTPIPLTVDGSGVPGAVPVDIAGLGGGSSSVAWGDVTDKPTVIAAGVDAAAARTAIGAGTSSVAVSSSAPAALATTATAGTSTSAARADHVHPYPTATQVGAAATTHTHAATAVTVAAIPNLTGANVQLALADIAARLKALEDATP